MKKLIFCLILFAAAISVFGQTAKLTLIFDGRAESEISIGATMDEAELIEKEIEKKEAVIRKKTTLDCDDDTFEVFGSVGGSFTKAKAAQKAFLYELCRSGRNFGIGGIVIMEAGKIVAHYTYGDNGLNSNIGVLPDINQNGFSEILLFGEGTGQGYASEVIEIVELTATGVTSFGFADIYSDNYGTGDEDTSATAYKISVQKGKIPVYFRETYTQKSDEGNWILTKKSQKFSLRKDISKFNKIL